MRGGNKRQVDSPRGVPVRTPLCLAARVVCARGRRCKRDFMGRARDATFTALAKQTPATTGVREISQSHECAAACLSLFASRWTAVPSTGDGDSKRSRAEDGTVARRGPGSAL